MCSDDFPAIKNGGERKMEKKQKMEKKLANVIAKWLLRDIRLNAEAASSPHLYEPDLPDELKEYKKNR